MSISEYGMLLKYVSLDLHNSNFEGNIMTEYEEKFSRKAIGFTDWKLDFNNAANSELSRCKHSDCRIAFLIVQKIVNYHSKSQE